MTKITTGIRNLSAKPGGAASLPPARRAWEKFKRNVSQMPLRLISVFGDCQVPPPSGKGGTLEKYLGKLSQNKLDPTDAMLALVRLAERKPEIGEGGLSEVQIYRLFGNLKSHGEMITVLDDFIARMRKKSDEEQLNQGETKFLALLQKMKKWQDSTAQKLMRDTAYGKDVLTVHTDADETTRLAAAFDEALYRVSRGGDGDVAAMLETRLNRAKDLRKGDKGTPEQKKFAKDSEVVKSTFSQEGIIAKAPLTTLVEHAFRKSGRAWPKEFAEGLVKTLIAQKSLRAQWNLLEPLLRAMSHQADGVETAEQDLRAAILKIEEASSEPEALEAPPLAAATNRLDVGAAIHDLARHVESKAPKGQKLDDDAFKAAVFDELNKQNLTDDDLMRVVDRAGKLTLIGRSSQVRMAVLEFIVDRLGMAG